ncbi:MAG: ribonuclease H [Planctomycetota bacterium]|nr:ribonuclease H [Planctomycetota bacterium]
MSFHLYTDGGCAPNPGPGGWAFVLQGSDGVVERFGGEPDSTNNRMELTAVIRGFEAALEAAQGARPALELVADSQYVLKGLTEWMPGWKSNNWTRKVSGRRKPVLNVDLWQRLDELRQSIDLTVTWVRGHTGHPGNERCDTMVKDGIRSVGGRVG